MRKSALSSKGLKILHIDLTKTYGGEFKNKHFNENKSFILNDQPSVIISNKYDKLNQLNLVLKSKIYNYLQFKLIDNYLYFNDSKKSFEFIPKSKQEIFNSQSFSLVDKRFLIKFFQFQFDVNENDKIKNFNFNLNRELLNSIFYSIGNSNNDDDTLSNSFTSIKEFLTSFGTYGHSSHIFAQFGGTSDIIQGYCRSSAVNGSTFMLDKKIESLFKSNDKFNLKLNEFDEPFTSKHLIVNPINLPEDFYNINKITSNLEYNLARLTLIIKGNPSIDPLPESPLITFPPNSFGDDGLSNTVNVLWQNDSAGICPPNHHIIYFVSLLPDYENRKPEVYFEPYIKSIINDESEIIHKNGYIEPIIKYNYSQDTLVDNLHLIPNHLLNSNSFFTQRSENCCVYAQQVYNEFFNDEEIFSNGNNTNNELYESD